MTFAWQGTQFGSLDLFRRYLAGMPRPAWVRGMTVHHTWKPEPQDWRGMASMDGLKRYYRDTQKWPAGPHLFLCVGAPDRRSDGIFIGTPLDTRGVHAGACNSDRWGIEVVGNFDAAPWSDALADLVYGVLLALAHAGGFAPSTVNGHRECGSPKSCPGAAIDMSAVRLEVQRRSLLDFANLWGRTDYERVKDFGITSAWRDQLRLGTPLGKALTDELGMIDGRVYRMFERGCIVWQSSGRVEVWR